MDYIPLEKPIVELETQIQELRRLSADQAIDLGTEIQDLEEKADSLREKIFSTLTPYEITQLSRHPRRPNIKELIQRMCSSFVELHGDRNFFDDRAIVGGVAVLGGKRVVIIGHHKGRDTKENIERNFGMAKPEGYRKALRLMSMAERFHLPIVTLIDTPGADPGVGAEQRGQSEAIGKNIFVMLRLKVPIVSVVIGEGGSGGALALAVGNRVHMLQYAVYSVISPEGCASILLKDSAQAHKMAKSLQLTAAQTLGLGVIDSVIPEPKGGAHRSPGVVAARLQETIVRDLHELSMLSGDELREHRMNKFLTMGII